MSESRKPTLYTVTGVNDPRYGIGPNEWLVLHKDYDALSRELAAARAELAQFHDVVIPSWKREELAWNAERDALRAQLAEALGLLRKIGPYTVMDIWTADRDALLRKVGM